MDQIFPGQFESLFTVVKKAFEAHKDFLVELDGKIGDGDLGLTMNKAYSAALDAVKGKELPDPGRIMVMVGMTLAKAAPSTMGTLMATGFMRGGNGLEQAASIGTKEMAAFWAAFAKGVAERGKAREGEKTLLDVAFPISRTLSESAECGDTLRQAMEKALVTASEALEATKSMVAQHGKAAVFREKALGLQDAGGTALYILFKAMCDFISD